MTKLRRSMLFVPGANAAMLSNTFIYQPDSIMFDLEDSVALREKRHRADVSVPCAAAPYVPRDGNRGTGQSARF